jgi:hypothetical protein
MLRLAEEHEAAIKMQALARGGLARIEHRARLRDAVAGVEAGATIRPVLGFT